MNKQQGQILSIFRRGKFSWSEYWKGR